MIPKEIANSGQNDLYRSRLARLPNDKHPLLVLADQIDWKNFLEPPTNNYR